MPSETWSITIGAATLLVITVASIAAIVQLRHLRSSNQLNALLKILELEQSPFLEERFHFVRTQLAAKMEDPEFRRSLEDKPVDRTIHPERHVIAWFEQIGVWLKYGFIDERAYLELAAPIVDQFWALLEPTVMIMRRTREPWLLENFEYLAARAQLWMREHPAGNYPKATGHPSQLLHPNDR